MNENISQSENNDQHKGLAMLLTVIATVLAAVLAALQSDASIRSDVGNRDSQYLAILASGELDRAGLEGSYEMSVFGDYLKNLQETTVYQLTALQQQQDGDKTSAQTTLLADSAQARADTSKKFSILYNDPRYMPATADGQPDAQKYILDLNSKANDIVAQQNKASDEYHRWNNKSDSYVTALTILAFAFFLFGLAQVVKNIRVRLAFIILGGLVLGVCLMITAVNLTA